MKLRPKEKLLAIVILAVLLCFLLFKWRSAEPNGISIESESTSSAKTTNESEFPVSHTNANPGSAISSAQNLQKEIAQKRQEMQSASQLWRTPILYYGKVIGESNQPVSGVQVSYSAGALNDSREEIYNKGTVTSDERGMCKIDGINGVGLMLQLSHSNYYAYPSNSTGFDKRSLPKKGYFSDSEEKAELFCMHSKSPPL